MMEIYNYQSGSSPLLISIPHAGYYIPDAIKVRMTPAGRSSLDTDWYVDKLYNFVKEQNISLLHANYSRYVIDLNRPPDQTVLYPGLHNTELCPLTRFDGMPIYLLGQEPSKHEIELRLKHYWFPYHNKIKQVIDDIINQYGFAIILDAHSIKSSVPSLFKGILPDINFGTNDNKTLPIEIINLLSDVIIQNGQYSHVINGRFKGGYITRNYVNLKRNIFTLQIELSQILYMNETPPFIYDDKKALNLQAVLNKIIDVLLQQADIFKKSYK
ncbi:MAG: N-formylglutamate deformylase [Alphaproteobacteria bacterium]|nr:N-formylglutamate deformylase [Alphaproteobacteria bacterium]